MAASAAERILGRIFPPLAKIEGGQAGVASRCSRAALRTTYHLRRCLQARVAQELLST